MDNLQARESFGWEEYVVFGALLLVSAGIGIFYGFFGEGKQKTTSEFLMADRKMSLFPMSMSVIASFISAVALLGIPAEMYNYGTQYSLIIVSSFFVMAASAHLYLPVFYKLQCTSTFEYLELRFCRSLRLITCTIFILQMTVYISIVVLAPALALSQVTGLGVNTAVISIFVIVVFYSTVGGMKAVMWTDAFQVFVMYGAMLLVLIKGSYDVGGIEAIWKTATEGDRIEFFNFDLDPRTRHTFWGLTIGAYFTWLTIYATNQTQVQRYLTVPTMKKAQTAIWINAVGFALMMAMCAFCGLVIYTKYSTCHPLYAGRIKSPDQLLPLFVMDTLGQFPGLPGFFVAGIFSGALSTVSSGLNSLAAVTLMDFLGPFYPKMKDSTAANVSKFLSFMFGVASFSFAIVAQKLGGIMQAVLSILGITGGPLLGAFTLGMFFPWVTASGATIGTIVSQIFMFWLGFGTHFAKMDGHIVFPPLPFRTDGCYNNATIPEPKVGTEGGIYEFYKISYIWYTFIGCIVSIIVALICSRLTSKSFKENARKVNPDFVTPLMLKLCEVGGDYDKPKQENEMVYISSPKY